MLTIIWALIIIALMSSFIKGSLGILGLLILAICIWNFVGNLWNYRNL